MDARTSRLLAMTVAVALGATHIPLRSQARASQRVSSSRTAAVAGVVLSTESTPPRALRRAIVTVSGADLIIGRSAITDDDGRFTIDRLPVGRVSLTAHKRGYVSGAFGATRPGRPGTPLVLAAGQSASVTILLARAGVIAGTIRDERGQPIAGLRVFPIDGRRPAAPRPAPGVDSDSSVLTDDRGVYRLHGLAPGNYVVAATGADSESGDILRRSDADTDALLTRLQARTERSSGVPIALAPAIATSAMTIAPVYYPGTSVLDDAARIPLSFGDVREGMDFVARAVTVTTIEGVVVSTEGALPASIEMGINQSATLRFFGLSSANPRLAQPPRADGHFQFTTIVPGRYTVWARANPATPATALIGRGGVAATSGDILPGGRGPSATAGQTLYAAEDVEVGAYPITGLTLRLQRGAKLTGRVAFDAVGQRPPEDLAGIRVALLPVDTSGMSIDSLPVGPIARMQSTVPRPDGTFELAGLAPGRYQAQVTMPTAAGGAWWFRSAMVGGRDVLDSALDVTLSTDISGAILTMTDRRSELSGTLRTAVGRPAPEYVVIVLPADRALRGFGSRRVRSTRPGTDGTYVFSDLPAGEYLIVALTDVEPGEWDRPEFLDAIAPGGVPIRLAEGEKKVQHLQVGSSLVPA